MRVNLGALSLFVAPVGLSSFIFLVVAIATDFWYIIDASKLEASRNGTDALSSHSGLWRTCRGEWAAGRSGCGDGDAGIEGPAAGMQLQGSGFGVRLRGWGCRVRPAARSRLRGSAPGQCPLPVELRLSVVQGTGAPRPCPGPLGSALSAPPVSLAEGRHGESGFSAAVT